MKKISLFIVMLLSVFILVSCMDNTHQNVFDELKIKFAAGDTQTTVTKDVTLPNETKVEGAKVLWISSQEDVILVSENKGIVTRPEVGNVVVELRLEVTINETMKSVSYNVLVLGLKEETKVTHEEVFSTISFDGTIFEDIILPTSTSLDSEAKLVWQSSHEEVLSHEGTVQRQAADVLVTLTLSLTLDGVTKEQTYDVIVAAIEVVDQHQLVFNAVVLPKVPTEDILNLPTSVLVVPEAKLSWTSSHESIVSNEGLITRPKEQDQVVTLTLSVTILEVTKQKNYVVTITKEGLPLDEYDQMFVEILSRITPIPAEITEDKIITLTQEISGMDVALSWESSSFAIEITWGSADVQLQVEEETAILTLTATFSETEVRTKAFEIFLHARPKEVTYQVTFMSDDDIYHVTSDIKKDTKIDAPMVPAKDNHRFEGWYLGEERFNFDETPITGNLTLVAKWTEITAEDALHTFDFGTKQQSGYAPTTRTYIDSFDNEFEFKSNGVQVSNDSSKGFEGGYLVFHATHDSLNPKGYAWIELSFSSFVTRITFESKVWTEADYARVEDMIIEVQVDGAWLEVSPFDLGNNDISGINAKTFRISIKTTQSGNARMILDNLSVYLGAVEDTTGPQFSGLEATKTVAYGNTLTKEALLEGVTALDIVEGDMTSNIELLGFEDILFDTLGSYVITYKVSDSKGNETVFETTIVIADLEKPVITGTKDLEYFIWDAKPNYLEGVLATDNVDTDLEIIVNDSLVNYEKAGSYKVHYHVKDLANNETKVTIILVVQLNQVNVIDEASLVEALSNYTRPIFIEESMTVRSTLIIEDDVVILGNHKKLNFLNEKDGLVIYGDRVTITNLTVDGASGYGIQVYLAQEVTLNSVRIYNSKKGGLLINGASVTVDKMTLTNNAWGGIEVSQGAGVVDSPLLTLLEDPTYTTNNDTPVIWIDGKTTNDGWVVLPTQTLLEEVVSGDQLFIVVVPTTVTITFNHKDVTNQTIKVGAKVTKPNDPTKYGYLFVEWQLDGVAFDFNTEVTKNITLEPIFKDTTSPVIKVEKELVETKLNIEITSLVEAFGITVEDNHDQDIEVVIVSDINYSVAGTYEIILQATDAASNQAIEVTVTVKVLNEFTVVFKVLEETVETLTVSENDTLDAFPEDPKANEGEVFLGWFDGEVKFELATKVTKNLELVAKFGSQGITYATDLFISEYIEGSSNNKAIEIFNGTGNTIDLSLYEIKLYTNGSTSAGSTLKLTGVLGHNEVYVIYNASADAKIKTAGDISHAVANFNGDDAIGLYKNNVLIDVFGVIGVDPGTGWKIGNQNNATVDHTIIRNSDIVGPSAVWNTSEWTILNKDNFDHIGKHEMDSGAPIPTYIVTFESNEGTMIEAQQITRGDVAIKPENPVKADHVFLGWYQDELLTEVWDFNTAISKSITLYAKWRHVDDQAPLGETFTETFDLLDNSGSQYISGTFKGVNGQVWSYTRSRGDQKFNNTKAITTDTGSLKTTFTEGLSAFSFDYIRAFTGTKERSFEVYINGELIETITVVANSDTAGKLVLTGLSYSGEVTVEIKGLGAQKMIDNVSWTTNP